MADIHLHAGSAPSVTCVSNYFIDHLLSGLSGDAVKVYLALLRCLGDSEVSFSCAEMSGRVGISAREVRTSLDALSAAGLVALDYDSEGELCDICVKDCNASGEDETDAEVTVTEEDVTSKQTAPEQEEAEYELSEENDGLPEMRKHPDASGKDPVLKEILFVAQKYVNHTLSNPDLQMILYWYYDLHMSEDLIDYLVTSVADRGKRSIPYMNKIAISWWKKDIHTCEEAILEQKQFSEETRTVRKSLGVGNHALTPAQMEFVDRWFKEWEFSTELVTEACNRATLKAGNGNFAYADSILKNWHDKDISTMEQVAAADEVHEKENEKKYQKKQASGSGSAGSFAFGETNGYDDDAIAAAMLKRKTF